MKIATSLHLLAIVGVVAAGTVTFTVFVDDECTQLPERPSTVVLDTAAACNPTPDASISSLQCTADGITYTNHPNNPDCTGTPISNTLAVGVCTAFPGPVTTFKLIDPATYQCVAAPAAPTPAAPTPPAPPADTVDCSGAMLLATQSGPGSSCPDTSHRHHWPLTGNTADCHGWKATDQTGRVHRNSAKNIRCSTTGREMLYDQYAGNLECSGSGVSKRFSLDECSEGIPAGLFDKAVDLDCCGNPEACLTGTPSVSNAGASDQEIFSNGRLCAPPTAPSSPATPPPTPPPTPVPTRSSDTYCPDGFTDVPQRFDVGLGRITIVDTAQACADRCMEYSGAEFMGGCKGFMTGRWYGMLLCRSYGRSGRSTDCARWANPGSGGACCTRIVALEGGDGGAEDGGARRTLRELVTITVRGHEVGIAAPMGF